MLHHVQLFVECVTSLILLLTIFFCWPWVNLVWWSMTCVSLLLLRAAIEATDFFSDRHLIELVGSLLHVYTKRMCVCVPWCVQWCGTAGSRGGRGGTETRRRKKRWRRLSSLTSSSSFCVILIGRGASSKRGWVWKPFWNDHPGLIGRFSFSY